MGCREEFTLIHLFFWSLKVFQTGAFRGRELIEQNLGFISEIVGGV
jgi:hypothetical protein